MTPDEERLRGEEAARILREPLVIEAFREIEANLIEQLAQAEQTPERVARLQSILVGKRLFERYFKVAVQTGRFAAEEAKRKATLVDRAKQAFRAI